MAVGHAPPVGGVCLAF